MSKKTLNQTKASNNFLRSLTFNDWVFILTVGCGVVGLLLLAYCQTTTAMGHEYSLI